MMMMQIVRTVICILGILCLAIETVVWLPNIIDWVREFLDHTKYVHHTIIGTSILAVVQRLI
jgi:hypothetical protein